MSTDDSTDEEDPGTDSGTESDATSDTSDVRERLEEGRHRAVEGFDEGVVDLLSWVLETETRARIYVFLRTQPDSTSEEIADGTGLYPSTVREALAELHEEGTVEREKRESDGAGNNPYEYRAIAPSALVRGAVEDIQTSLNDVFQLDRYMGGEDTGDEEPVTITVEAEEEDTEEWGEPGGDEDADEGNAEEDADEETEESEAEEEEEAEEDGEDQDEGQDEDIDESL